VGSLARSFAKTLDWPAVTNATPNLLEPQNVGTSR
jgi:hypothetical protein